MRLTLVEASAEAAALGSIVSASTLRVQLMKERLHGKKRGRDWVITRQELLTYLDKSSADRPARETSAKEGLADV